MTITATLGSASQTATVTVQAGVLVSLSFEPSSVRSQGNTIGTVTLSASAPPGGATVALESSNKDVLKVPSTVVVPAGSLRATFMAESATIRFSTPATVDATYAGVKQQATVTVGPPEIIANFSVISESRGADACAVVATGAGGTRMDCLFDGSASGGFPTRWRWTLRNGDKSEAWVSTEASTRPPIDCSVLGGGSLSNGALGLTAELIVTSNEGQSSVSARSILFYPNGSCGY